MESEERMDTRLVFAAERRIGHEFLLATLAMKAVYKMHRPGTRIEETMSEVFGILSQGRPVDLSETLFARK